MVAALRQVTAGADPRLARAVLGVVLALVVLPIALGAAVTLRGALDGGAWAMLAATSGLATSLRLTLVSGIAATVLSCLLALALARAIWLRQGSGRLLAPLLAAPHAATAVGLAFLIAPSGWIARLFSPWATGWDRPPDLATVNDPAGIALIAGLVVKEVPFLTLMALSQLSRLPVARDLAEARAMGYAPGAAWVRVILPQLWPLLRLPVAVVASYGLSVVDLAIILGPSSPPTLAVLILRDFTDPDLARRGPAAAAAVVQAGLVAAVLLAGLAADAGLRRAGVAWLGRGRRGRGSAGLDLTAAAAAVTVAAGLAALAAVVLWSLVWRWPWPEVLPSSLGLRQWAAGGDWAGLALATAGLALAATLIALLLAVAWLEAEDRAARPRAHWAEVLVYLPLVLPQVVFLFGLHIGLLSLGTSAGLAAVLWSHVLFVFPYVMIALSAPWRALDPALVRSAAALGAGPLRRLVAVKLPCLLHPVLTAAAIGFGVSVALYLPTLALGGGRVATLATETVTLASGGDRRILGVTATAQTLLPWTVYALAWTLPLLLFRNRRGLRGLGR
jgi:putative thiamine transport system permease protein